MTHLHNSFPYPPEFVCFGLVIHDYLLMKDTTSVKSNRSKHQLKLDQDCQLKF